MRASAELLLQFLVAFILCSVVVKVSRCKAMCVALNARNFCAKFKAMGTE